MPEEDGLSAGIGRRKAYADRFNQRFLTRFWNIASRIVHLSTEAGQFHSSSSLWALTSSPR